MKHITLSLSLSLALSLGSHAQITIVQSDLPTVNNPWQSTQAVASPLLNYAATGANSTWNFTNLQAQGQVTDVYQSVASTGLIYALTYADVGFNANRANLAKPGTDAVLFGLLQAENPYTFRYRNASAYKTVGYGVEVAGISVPIIFQQHDVIYELPLNFGNTSASFSRWNLDVPTLAYYGYEQLRTNVVDGWGTVNTPGGSFEALRVKSTIAGKDTVQIDELSFGFAIDRPVVTEYKWLAKDIRVPVLQINTIRIGSVEVVTEVFFHDQPRTITVEEPLAASLCPGASVPVNYVKTGAFNQGNILFPANVFRAQLSDANGSFANPVLIGSVTSTQSGTINATIPLNTPAGTGYRIRVIATSPGFTGTDNGFDISIGALPLASIAPNGPTAICDGSSVELLASTDPDASIQWLLNGGAISGGTDALLEVSTGGSYTVQTTNACGTTTSAALLVTINEPPVHVLPATGLFTCDGLPITIEATDLSGQSDLEYQWFLAGALVNDATEATITTAQAGDYTLLTTNTSTGCAHLSAPAELVVGLVDAPSLVSMGSTTFCAGGTVVLEAIGDGETYVWFQDGQIVAGAETNELLANEAGSYTVAAVSVAGCVSQPANFITVVVIALPETPAATASGATTFCAGGAVLLEAADIADATYQWSVDGNIVIGADGQALLASTSGSYTVTITDDEGCTSPASLSIEVLVNEVPNAPVLSSTTSAICDGSSTTLFANEVLGTTLQWYLNGEVIDGATNAELTATIEGIYSALSTSPNGCASEPSNTLQLSVLSLPEAPSIGADGPANFCQGDSVLLIADGVSAGDVQWAWNGFAIVDANENSFTVLFPGTYTAWTMDAEGCISAPSNAVTVIVNDIPATPELQASGNTTFCAGGSVVLSHDAGANASYLWSLNGSLLDGEEASELTASAGGDYSLVVISAEGCSSEASEAVTVTVNAVPVTPELIANGATTFCAGGSVELSYLGDGGSPYLWSLNGTVIDGANGASLVVMAGGDFTLVVTSAEGCTSGTSNTITVTVNPLPAVPVITQSVGTLSASGSGPFQWYLNGNPIANATNSTYEVTENGDYTVVVTGGNGCSSTSEVFPFNSVGVNEIGAPGLSVYPNPSNGNFTIRMPSTSLGNSFYSIHDATGKLVLQGALVNELTPIQLPSATSGMYFLQVVHEGQSTTQRILVGR